MKSWRSPESQHKPAELPKSRVTQFSTTTDHNRKSRHQRTQLLSQELCVLPESLPEHFDRAMGTGRPQRHFDFRAAAGWQVYVGGA